MLFQNTNKSDEDQKDGFENDIGAAKTDKNASEANVTRREADGINITLK